MAIINISVGALLGLSSTSCLSANDDNNMGTTATLLSTTASSLTLGGNEAITVKTEVAELNTTKAYVQSLSKEELEKMSLLLDEKEECLLDYTQKTAINGPKTRVLSSQKKSRI